MNYKHITIKRIPVPLALAMDDKHEASVQIEERIARAAPELLSALQGLVAELERTSYYSIPEHHPSKAAIRAATGGAA